MSILAFVCTEVGRYKNLAYDEHKNLNSVPAKAESHFGGRI